MPPAMRTCPNARARRGRATERARGVPRDWGERPLPGRMRRPSAHPGAGCSARFPDPWRGRRDTRRARPAAGLSTGWAGEAARRDNGSALHRWPRAQAFARKAPRSRRPHAGQGASAPPPPRCSREREARARLPSSAADPPATARSRCAPASTAGKPAHQPRCSWQSLRSGRKGLASVQVGHGFQPKGNSVHGRPHPNEGSKVAGNLPKVPTGPRRRKKAEAPPPAGNPEEQRDE